jgi:hypothetical protein
MSKTSNRAKLECLKTWKDSLKIKSKKKKKPEWLKESYENEF